MIVISNASPLIGLCRINRLHLLRDLWSNILIPEAVYQEVVVHGSGRPGAQSVANACRDWIQVRTVSNRCEVEALQAILDDGEAEAIALGQELQANLLLLDNREPRLFAKKVGLPVMGTVGILRFAWQKGLLGSPGDELSELQRKGFWIDDALIEQIRRETQKR